MSIFLLLLLCGIRFVIFSSRMIVSPLLPVIEDELALTHASAGSFLVFLGGGYTATMLLAGFLSPRIGYKRTIMIGFLVVTTTLYFLQYATTYVSLALFMLLIGIGAGVYLPSVIPIITTIFGRRNWGKAIALHDTAGSSSAFCVPILTALALHSFSWKTLFTLLSVACLIAVICFWVFVPDPPRPQNRGYVWPLSIFKSGNFWIITILGIFAMACQTGLYNVIPLFLVKERGIPLQLANTVFGISRVGGLFAIVSAGLLADRYGVKRILFLGLLITGVSTMGLSFARDFTLLVVMLFLQATISLTFFPVSKVAISQLTTLDERSLFTGVSMAIGMVLGFGVTPALLGAWADVWNFQSGILILGVATCLSAFLVKGFRQWQADSLASL
jgi:NNP family nitrate/nitrite transporter-like MFS transporter